MQLFLVRHAHAGSRSDWVGDDCDRPLSPKGEHQASRIAEAFSDAGVARILSSPAARCVQTVGPLADVLDLEIEIEPDLFEGSDHRRVLALAERLEVDTALCSHGDVIPDLLRSLRKDGLELLDEFRWSKGSVWTIERDGHRWTTARYFEPPKG